MSGASEESPASPGPSGSGTGGATPPDSPHGAPAASAADPSDPRWRLPQVRGHLAGLDGIRALAALLVLVFHVGIETGDALAPGLSGALLAGGEMAVPLFFALSGLLLFRPWARAALDGTAAPPAGSYLRRRALRVLPAYWIVALAALLLWSRDHLDSVSAWVEIMTLTFVFETDPWWVGTGPAGLGQMWSLSVEAAFYAALPVLGLLAVRTAGRTRAADTRTRARRILVFLAVLTALSVLALVPQHYPEPRPYMFSWLPRCLGLFAVGMTLTVLSEWAWREPGADGPVRRLCRTLSNNATLCWAVAGGFYLVSATPAAGDRFVGAAELWLSLVNTAVSMAFAFFVVAPVALRPERPGAPPPARAGGGAWLEALLAHPVMRYLGRISYGIFLWQFVVLYLWRDFTGAQMFTGSFWMDLTAVALGTVLLADLTHRFVERPLAQRYSSSGSLRRRPRTRPRADRRTPIN
ncbi:acyltransferase family protein [Streptomonospora salina]|uniref:Peptidoglycan/LPS O-acetylase OafA/YrhL n=1 Tax=Streptomonospora salina TaxID=104205 RepID=A0A841E4C9_9ACTN|nr:peptidoglycan/LPS O-acetylase OafA/YrhL [Streptomonospora salina]